jgi:hypothetical protein
MAILQNVRVALPTDVSGGTQQAIQNMGTPVLQAVSSNTASAASAAAAASNAGCNGRPFGNPTAFSFTSLSNVASQLIKFQSPDQVVESVYGSQGTIKFGVSSLPDRTGLALGGNDLLGCDALRSRLLVFAMLVGQINYDGGIFSQLSNPINILTANVDGNRGSQAITADEYVNNMQNISSLVTLTSAIVLHANTLITMTKDATAVIKLTLSRMSPVAYSDPTIFG